MRLLFVLGVEREAAVPDPALIGALDIAEIAARCTDYRIPTYSPLLLIRQEIVEDLLGLDPDSGDIRGMVDGIYKCVADQCSGAWFTRLLGFIDESQADGVEGMVIFMDDITPSQIEGLRSSTRHYLRVLSYGPKVSGPADVASEALPDQEDLLSTVLAFFGLNENSPQPKDTSFF